MTTSWKSKLRLRDLIGTSLISLRSRRGRTALTALGIAIGIASMVAVVGISASSRAALLTELDAFGTNLLQVQASSVGMTQEPLPIDAQPMLNRLADVSSASAVTTTGFEVHRTTHDASVVGITAVAVDPDLFETMKMSLVAGRWFDDGTRSLPVAVLGDVAAERIGITDLRGGPTVTIAGRQFVVVGLLDELPLHPDLARNVMIGDEAAVALLATKPNPSAIYLRVDLEGIDRTRPLLAATANPDLPTRVEVSRPSDLIEARAQVDQSLQRLLLALGGVALLVGGVGIANVMVISVLERRGEIGLRRALGATRGHIRSQFVLEAGVLSGLGGLLGVALGALITAIYARRQEWVVELPPLALIGGVAAALAIGMIAGLYPAAKAARLDPALAVSGGTG